MKEILEAMPRADPSGPLRDPHGESEDRKDVKTGSVSEWRNNLALEKGSIKLSECYRALRGIINTRKGTKRLSGCVDW